MPRYPAATWRGPVPNVGGDMAAHHGLVLHIQEGTESGTDAWVHNPASKVSAHFGNPKIGPLDQWVDTDEVAWAQAAGNPYWVSVENEGNSGDTLTPSQAENVARLLVWLHTTYGVPLQVAHSVDTGGLAYHALGGEPWGNHPDCPGDPIIAQRPHIVARALEIVGTPIPTRASVSVILLQRLLNTLGAKLVADGVKGPLTRRALLAYLDSVPTLVAGSHGNGVKAVQAALGTWGAILLVDGAFGPGTLAAVKAFQAAGPATLTVDGAVGPLTKAKLAS